MEITSVLLFIIVGIIILIAGYLAIIYIILRIRIHRMKDKAMIKACSYPCYLNIILSSIIAIDNISRLFTNKKEGFFCQFQAITLAIFDKLIYTTMTVNAYLTYIGLSNNEFYMENIKKLFIITNSISFFIAIILGIIFLCNGTVNYNVCYVKGGYFKETTDTIVMSILFVIYLYSSVNSLLFLLRNIKELSLNNSSINGYLIHFYRIFVSLFLSSLSFLITLLIINDSLFMNDDFIDICFISTCLVIDLFYTLNITIIKETIKLCCCKVEQLTEKEFYDSEESDNDNDNDEGRYSSLNYIQ